MDLAYSLDESDIIALAEYRFRSTPAARRQVILRRVGYLVGFSLLAAGAWVLNGPALLVLFWLFLGAALYLLYPRYYAWNMRRRIRAAYRDEKMRAFLAARTLRLTDEGLEEISGLGEVKIKWDAIQAVAVTPTRAFVTVAGAPPAMVISRGRVTAGNYDDWIAACQKHVGRKTR